jgi:hypothetical protein
MPGFRWAMTLLLCAVLIAPSIVMAEEPSQLLQHNEAGTTHLDDQESHLTTVAEESSEFPQYHGDATTHINAEESPWASFLNPQQSPHAGLLGKRYFGAAYAYGHTDDSIFPNGFLNEMHGFALSLNSPLITGDGTKPIATDVFAGYSQFFGRDRHHFGMASIRGDLDLIDFELGITIYTEAIPRLRPFAQLGWAYSHANLTLKSPFGVFEDSEQDSGAFFKLGSELDLSKHFALRGALDFDHDEFKSSTFTGELIFSPNEEEFFRIGAFTDLDGFFYGAIVGGGVKF